MKSPDQVLPGATDQEKEIAEPVQEKPLKDKSWLEIERAVRSASGTDRIKLIKERDEAWVALKDLIDENSGEIAPMLDGERERALNQISIWETTVSKPPTDPSPSFKIRTPDWEDRQVQQRQKSLDTLEAWKKRLDSINSIINARKIEEESAKTITNKEQDDLEKVRDKIASL